MDWQRITGSAWHNLQVHLLFEIPNVFEELRLRLWVCIRRVHFLQALLDFVLLTVSEPNPQFLDKWVLEEFDSEGTAVLIENLKEQEP